jgi:hypothetical protein
MYQLHSKPIQMTLRPKARVCGHSLAGIAGSNLPNDMEVCLLWVLWIVRPRFLWRYNHSSRGVVPGEVCLSVISEPQRWAGLGQLELSSRGKKTISYDLRLTFQYFFSHHFIKVGEWSTVPQVAGNHLQARGEIFFIYKKSCTQLSQIFIATYSVPYAQKQSSSN